MKKRFAYLSWILVLAMLAGMAAFLGRPAALTAQAGSADYILLDDCDTNSHFKWQPDAQEKMQGKASMRTGVSTKGAVTLNNSGNFGLSSPENLSELTLEFWFYVGDLSTVTLSKTTVELYQTVNDVYTWNYKAIGTLKKGWNKVLLPISSATAKGTVTRLNQVRINLNVVKSGGVFRIDDVLLTTLPTANDRTGLEAAIAKGKEMPASTLDTASPGLKTALEEALAYAETVKEDPSASQRDVDQAAQRLTDAINAFGFDGFSVDPEVTYSYVDMADQMYNLMDSYGVENGNKSMEHQGVKTAGFTGALLLNPAAQYVEGKADMRFTLRYFDGEGGLELHYTGEKGDTVALTLTFGGTNAWRNATVRVQDAALARAFNGYDLMIKSTGGSVFVNRFETRLVAANDLAETAPPEFAPQNDYNNIIGASSIGYQMWFTATATKSGWVHWGEGEHPRPAPGNGNLSFDVYPYVQDYIDNGATLYESELGELGNGQPSLLFTSKDRAIVDTHFQWITKYGIDCMAIQRFGIGYDRQLTEEENHLCLVRDMAEKYKKTFYVMYDVSGQGSKDSDTFFDLFTDDVVRNIERCNVSNSPAYAHAHGKPVICIWGISGNDSNYVRGYTASRVINWLQDRGYYVIVGTPDNGYNTREGEWLEPFTMANMISPWTVGRYNYGNGGNIGWLRNHLAADIAFCEQNGSDYQPVIFPGFSWTTMRHNGRPNAYPRMAGAFAWQQARQAVAAGVKSVYFAMFDEYDEGTAWMKGGSDYFDIPKSQYFVTYATDGTWLSNDYYLRLAGHITKYFKGEVTDSTLTIPHSQGPVYWRNSFERRWTTYLEGPDDDRRQSTVLCNIDVCAPLSILMDNKGIQINIMTDAGLPDYPYVEEDPVPAAYATKREGTGLFRDVSGAYVKSGEWAFLMDATATGSDSRFSYVIANCDIMVSAAGLQLTYGLYAETDPGKNVYVDLFLEDGTSLSGEVPALAQARGSKGKWVDVTVDLPASLVGRRIRYIGVSWKGGAGEVKAVLDDIILQSPGTARNMLRTAIATASGLKADEALTAAIAAATAVQNSGSVTDKHRLEAMQAIDTAIRAMDEVVPAGGSDPQVTMGDVDGDGKVSSTDARLILQYSVGKITEWP